MTTGFRQILVQATSDEMRTVSISTIVRQEEPTCKLTERTGKSHNKVWVESPLVFLLLGVWMPWRLCNTNVLHSQGERRESSSNKFPAEEPLLVLADGQQQPGTAHHLWPRSSWRSDYILAEHRQGPLGLLRSPDQGQGHHLTLRDRNSHYPW